MKSDLLVIIDELEMLPPRVRWEVEGLATAIQAHEFTEQLTTDGLTELGSYLQLSEPETTTLDTSPDLAIQKSFIQGYPCFVVTFRRQSILFAGEQLTSLIGESLAYMDQRIDVLRNMDILWHETMHEADLKDVALTRAVTRFTEHHRDTLSTYRVPLLAFIDAPNDEVEAFCRSWDNQNLSH